MLTVDGKTAMFSKGQPDWVCVEDFAAQPGRALLLQKFQGGIPQRRAIPTATVSWVHANPHIEVVGRCLGCMDGNAVADHGVVSVHGNQTTVDATESAVLE